MGSRKRALSRSRGMATRPTRFRHRGAPSRIEQRREYDARRRVQKPWRNLYKTARWAAIRQVVLADQPLCVRCLAEGVVEPATVVNHVHRHGGDEIKFFAGPFEGICKPHHDRDVQREERASQDGGRGVESRQPPSLGPAP